MSIDYGGLVDGLAQLTQKVGVGRATVADLDAMMAVAHTATGALGATFMEYLGEHARVVAATGELSWARGQPIVARHTGSRHTGAQRPGRGSVDGFAPALAERLLGREVRTMAGQPVRTPQRLVGAVHVFFGAAGPGVWAELVPVLQVVANAVAQVWAAVNPPAAARDDLSTDQDNDDRTLFLAVAGHELRTPVTVVKSYASMLADRWDDLDEANRRGAARVLTQRADELARLVDRLLGVSVGDDTGGWLVHNSPFDLVDALRRAVGDLPADLRRGLRLELPHQLPTALGDPTALTAVIAELVNNAVRHTVAPPEPAAVVEVHAGADAQTVFIRVGDRGVGIDPAHVERAFDRFWRAHDDDGRGGVGLGLYLVRRLVERQNGWVSLRPRDDGGTIAEVRLRRAGRP